MRVEQTQTVNADNPAFAFSLPVEVRLPGADGKESVRYVYVVTDQTVAGAAFPLPVKPVDVRVDPYLTVLCRSEIRQPLEQTLRQIGPDATLWTRLRAVDALARSSDPRAVAALVHLTFAGSGEPGALVRAAASEALSVTLARAGAAIDRLGEATLARTEMAAVGGLLRPVPATSESSNR